MGLLRRAVLALLAAGLGAAAFFLYGFGGCHSGGGFCAGAFTSTNTAAYVLSAAAAGLAAACLTGAPRRDVATPALVGVATTIVVAAMAVTAEA